MSVRQLTVYGILGPPTPQLRAATAQADRVVGGQRHLDALGVEPDRRILLGTPSRALQQIARLPTNAEVVFVASGDPLFFGVVRTLRNAGIRARVIAAPTSAAAAFAAVGLPWEDAVIASAHGRPIAHAMNLARAFPKVAVLTSAAHGIRELAAGLADLNRWFVLAERLGEDDQRVRLLDPAAAVRADALEPNVVLVLERLPAEADAPWTGWAALPPRPARPDVCAAAALAFARTLPSPGELVSASGPLSADFSALARWSQAAVIELPRCELPLAVGAPDVILAPARVDELIDLTARAVVLTGTPPDALPAGYRWRTETITGHQLTTGVRE